MTDSAIDFFRTAAAPNGWHQDPGHAHVSRGIELEPDEGWHPEAAHRILSGQATHDDLLHHVNTDHVGHYWSTHNTADPNELETPKGYAEPREPMANWTQHAGPGENVLGAAGVVLVGHRPHGWNPDDNPDEGLMGNSYLPEHSHIPLHEIHYSGDGETWHRLTPPAGTTVHTDGPPRSATAHFAAYDAPEGGSHGTQRADRAADRPGDRGGDPAAGSDGRRPQPGRGERAEGPARRVRAAAAAVERHPELQGDLDRLGGGARHVQDTITALQHGHSGVTTYPLSHPLEGWHAAITSGGHQVVHRTDPDTKTLHVGYAGHNVADAEERLGAKEHSSLPVEFHSEAEKDFDKMPSDVQGSVLDTVDRLSRRQPRATDHTLGLPLRGWSAAHVPGFKSHRVTHRYEDANGTTTAPEHAVRLFIGHIGPHNYDDAVRRLASATEHFRQIPLQRVAEAVDNSDGVMVAFVPPPEVAQQLALQGGQLADDLHITLAYLGKAASYTKQQLALLPQVVSTWAKQQRPVTIRIAGVGTFNNSYKDQHVLWAHPDIPGGAHMHVSLAKLLEQYSFHLPSEHGWTAHMTLKFVNQHERFMPRLPATSWVADQVVTFIGGTRHTARLGLHPSTPTAL